METLFIPTENDFSRWIKEAIEEYFKDALPSLHNHQNKPPEDF